jgi:hypothetical protein
MDNGRQALVPPGVLNALALLADETYQVMLLLSSYPLASIFA